MQDNKPINEKKQAHGCWIIHHSNGGLWFNGYYINGQEFGCFEYWNWNNTSSKKEYYAV